MPGVAPAIIAAVIGAAATATVGGLELSGVGGPSGQIAAMDAQKLQQAQQDALQKKEAAVTASGQTQAQTGGNLTGAAFDEMVSNLINSPGSWSQVQQWLASNPSGSGGSPTPGLENSLTSLTQ